MIKTLLAWVFGMAVSSLVSAQQQINIVFPYAPSHGTTPAFYALVSEANRLQNRYQFILEPKVGGNGLIALNHMRESPQNRVAIIAPAFVDNADNGQINEGDYVHVVGMGDMCMAVFNKHGDESRGIESLKGTSDLVLGGVGWANSSHLIGLQIGERYGLQVRNIVFKSNKEGLINLAQDGGVTQVIDRINSFDEIQAQAKVKAKILGVTCSRRLTNWPQIKTLREQGITAPSPWIIITSHKDMPAAIRTDLSQIINQSLRNIGEQRIWEMSSLQPLVFTGQKLDEFYNQKANDQRVLLRRYRALIDADRGSTK